MRKSIVCVLALAATACALPQQPLPITPPGEVANAPVVRRPLPPAAAPTPPGVAAPPIALSPTLPAVTVPAGLLYVCVTDIAGERKQVGIEFAPKVHDLCSRHPEMGPCQYERQACRASGGRVFAAKGEEITMATEAEYDKKVLRVRFRAN
jgi:hypothetical protein